MGSRRVVLRGIVLPPSQHIDASHDCAVQADPFLSQL